MAQVDETDRKVDAWRALLAANVYAARTALNWSMEKLAGEADLSKETIRVVEAARLGTPARSLNLDTLASIAAALGKEPWELLRSDPAATRVFMQGKSAWSPTLISGDKQQDGQTVLNLANLS